jgi:hypothetical protein
MKGASSSTPDKRDYRNVAFRRWATFEEDFGLPKNVSAAECVSSSFDSPQNRHAGVPRIRCF